MKVLSPTLEAALANPVVPLMQLVKLEFEGETLGLNTSNLTVEWGGVSYAGASGLGAISPIDDSPGEVKGLTLALNGAPAEMVALALDSADDWQGAGVTVYTAALDADYKVAGAAIDWTGSGDVMSLAEDGQQCAISATAESSAVSLLRSGVLHYSAADQASIDPTDLGFNMVIDKADEPVIWPAKEWYYK